MGNIKLAKGHRYIMIFIIIALSILIFKQFINEVIGSIGLVASVMIVIYQLSCENDVTLGSFILELNNSFVDNERIQVIYNKLKVYQNLPLSEQAGWITEKDRPYIDEYFVFFETISVLHKKRVVEMKVLDEMFGYRFFIAMNNPLVQEIELAKTGFEHYGALIQLYDEWRAYRIKKGSMESIPGEIEHSFMVLLEGEN
jgi:hypothetical protein